MIETLESRVMLSGATGPISAPWADTIVQLNTNVQATDSSNNSFNYIQLDLYTQATPITVANYVQYITAGRYDNTIFHRDLPTFVLQGGGYTPTVNGSTVTALPHISQYSPIQNEFSATRSNLTGTIAMAKLGGDPNSATSEWFINLADNSSNLDNQNGGFTVFGKVMGDGMILVNDIAALGTSNLNATYDPNYAGDASTGPFTDVPLKSGAGLVNQLVEISAAEVVPRVALSSPATDVLGGSSVSIAYSLKDTDSTSHVTLYYDTNNSGYGGTQFASFAATTSGTYSWNTNSTSIPDGAYYIYAKVTNTNGAGSSSGYSVGRVVVHNSGVASKLAFTQQPTGTVTGAAISPAVKVAVQDLSGTTVSGNASIVTLTLSGGTFSGGGTTVTATASNGVATFSNLIINAAGTYHLTATDGSLTSATSSNFTIVAATPPKITGTINSVTFKGTPSHGSSGAANVTISNAAHAGALAAPYKVELYASTKRNFDYTVVQLRGLTFGRRAFRAGTSMNIAVPIENLPLRRGRYHIFMAVWTDDHKTLLNLSAWSQLLYVR